MTCKARGGGFGFSSPLAPGSQEHEMPVVGTSPFKGVDRHENLIVREVFRDMPPFLSITTLDGVAAKPPSRGTLLLVGSLEPLLGFVATLAPFRFFSGEEAHNDADGYFGYCGQFPNAILTTVPILSFNPSVLSVVKYSSITKVSTTT